MILLIYYPLILWMAYMEEIEKPPEKPPVPVTQCPTRYADGVIIDNRIKPTKKPKRND